MEPHYCGLTPFGFWPTMLNFLFFVEHTILLRWLLASGAACFFELQSCEAAACVWFPSSKVMKIKCCGWIFKGWIML